MKMKISHFSKIAIAPICKNGLAGTTMKIECKFSSRLRKHSTGKKLEIDLDSAWLRPVLLKQPDKRPLVALPSSSRSSETIEFNLNKTTTPLSCLSEK